MKNKSWDFWSDKKMSYDQRVEYGAGDVYGEGEKPKVGSLRSSYVAGEGGIPRTKELRSPPKKTA